MVKTLYVVQSGDGRPVVEASMRPLVLVEVIPGGQSEISFCGIAPVSGIGPLAQVELPRLRRRPVHREGKGSVDSQGL